MSAIHEVRIGTRGSELALWQAHHVKALIEARGVAVELVIIKTQGDRITDLPFSKMEGKGFFTKELEDAQLDGRVDLAVHSLKDLGSEMPRGLVLGALIGREDPRDLLLARRGVVTDPERPLALAPGARVGTSSARRQAQLRGLVPGVAIADLRGNVPTRIGKLRDGAYDAIVIACAGVTRLGLDTSDLDAFALPPETFVPAPGQGMLGVQCRDEAPLLELAAALHTAETARAVLAERAVLERLDGGCHLPFGCHVRPHADHFLLDLFLEDPGHRPLQLHLAGAAPEALAEEAWAQVLAERGTR